MDAHDVEVKSFQTAANATADAANRWARLIQGFVDNTSNPEDRTQARNEYRAAREKALALQAEADPNRIAEALARCNQSDIPDDCRDLFAQYKASADDMPQFLQANVAILDAIEAVDAAMVAIADAGLSQTLIDAFKAASSNYSAAVDHFNALRAQWSGKLDAHNAAVDKCNAALR